MLREHLSQEHDRASRRQHTIARHVEWIDKAILAQKRSSVLDLACGPGLYCAGLARRGHACVGIDFAPAALAHARAQAERERLACEYRLQDIRSVGYGRDFDLALLISGELNVLGASRPPRSWRKQVAPCAPAARW